jgi:ribosomal protein S18 acetylase RimI-like enzyme
LDYFHNPRSFELMIFIHQDHRYRGVGTRVLAGLKNLLSNQESREIWLVVQNSNIPAVKCFQKAGFAFMGPIDREREMVCRLESVGPQ